MAIFLRDLYYDTKRKYNLNLISGGKGMENIVSWVYISEDISKIGRASCRERV